MKKITNLEVKRAYDTVRGEKDKFGSYRKTLFYVHTPESHDYRLFKKWEKLSELLSAVSVVEKMVRPICFWEQLFS